MKGIMFLLNKYKIALSSTDDKRMWLIDSTETYACGASKNLTGRKEEIKCKYIMKQYKNYYLWWYCKRKHKIT